MPQEEVVIPDKLFFKIGEVCDLVGVQAHVLRYWETEFPMFSPQKNQSGQRSYRKKDVEMAIGIKRLLYKEMFTIAGARKKLQSDTRHGSRPKGIDADSSPDPVAAGVGKAQMLFDIAPAAEGEEAGLSARQREAIRNIAVQLVELRDMLGSNPSHAA